MKSQKSVLPPGFMVWANDQSVCAGEIENFEEKFRRSGYFIPKLPGICRRDQLRRQQPSAEVAGRDRRFQLVFSRSRLEAASGTNRMLSRI